MRPANKPKPRGNDLSAGRDDGAGGPVMENHVIAFDFFRR